MCAGPRDGGHAAGSWQQAWHRLDPLRQQQLERQWWRERAQQAGAKAARGAAAWRRRLWRYVAQPSTDWCAADWSFDDGDDGVAVLQLLMADQPGRVAALALRDDRQANKPVKVRACVLGGRGDAQCARRCVPPPPGQASEVCSAAPARVPQVYLGGEFVAAVLDDVVLQPLTGRLMAAVYRYATPGVHTVVFLLPNAPGASRVLAKLQRRWLPPSSTWLFPPRAASHDSGSWVLEWEGDDARDRPGWLPPAVFVLVAGFASLDLEARRLARRRRRPGSAGRLRAAWARAWRRVAAAAGVASERD